MPESNLQIQAERTPEGHFAKGQSGNPAGKPLGCRNRASRAVDTLLEGGAEALTRRVMEFAFDGDPTAMRLCFERIIAPRRARPVQLDLPPIADAADITAAMAAVTAAVVQGIITPAEGAEVARVVDTYVRAIEASDFDRRLKALEADYAAEV
jgi:Family of unknown function (DUF5681)